MSSASAKRPIVLGVLLALLILTTAVSARFGAIDFSTGEILSAVARGIRRSQELTLNQRIFLQLRAPRVILCLFTGAALGVGGALMQALFRNPIVEPGLVGTSSGAALGAALFYAAGNAFPIHAGEWSLPISACTGGILSTYFVSLLAQSKRSGRDSILLLLLSGMAVNALCLSAVGFLSYLSRDPQARSITFWNLGTISGASWHAVIVVGGATVISIIIAFLCAKPLNTLMMGEDDAVALGVNVTRLKWAVLTINVFMIGIATAFTGVISFVGLLVPHVLRMLGGTDNRFLVLGSALLGGILLSLADLLARTCFRPAELPIGIVTSVVGVPVFLILLRRYQYLF